MAGEGAGSIRRLPQLLPIATVPLELAGRPGRLEDVHGLVVHRLGRGPLAQPPQRQREEPQRRPNLAQLAPEKSSASIHQGMGQLHQHIRSAQAERQSAARSAIVSRPQARRTRPARPPAFAPGGHSTQMIVGADAADDGDIILASARLYSGYGLRRVYYSAFSPIPDASAELPLIAPPLVREHRLYQADWLVRFYGFEAGELVPAGAPGQRMLSLEHDPKLAWALAHRERFPVNLNTAARELLLRVPGLGVLSVDKLMRKVEANVHVRGKALHAEAVDGDMYAAIDLLSDKLDRMVLKHKEIRAAHRPDGGGAKRQSAGRSEGGGQ